MVIGDKGDNGNSGVTGLKGLKGAIGNPGPNGLEGETGLKGCSERLFVWCSENEKRNAPLVSTIIVNISDCM